MEVSMFPIIHHLSFMKKIKKVTWAQTFCKMNPLKISPLTKETECSILDHEKKLYTYAVLPLVGGQGGL